LRPRDDACFNAATAMTFVVTIVHGTIPFRWLTRLFAALVRRQLPDTPDWARRDSALCKVLAETLPGEVILQCFGWSGANSGRARSLASARLRHHLEDVIAQYPSAHHFVIAHSHGGNIALYATDSDTVKRHLNGIVCLSTPFIALVDRAGWLTPFFVAHLYLSALLGVMALIAAGIASEWSFRLSGWWSLLYFVLPFLAIVIVSRHLVTFADGVASKWQRKIALPKLDWLGLNRLLIIKGVGDEANSFLSVAQFVAFSTGGPIRRAALLAGASADLIERTFRDRARVFRMAATAVAAIVFTALSLVLGVLLFPLMVVTICASIVTWGAHLGVLSPFIELSAESTPSGTWQVTQFEGYESGHWTDLFGTELRTMAHSTMYSDARAIKAIVDWMNVQARVSVDDKDRPAPALSK
jgi:hypothetical protein